MGGWVEIKPGLRYHKGQSKKVTTFKAPSNLRLAVMDEII
jgi:hypothetical protein